MKRMTIILLTLMFLVTPDFSSACNKGKFSKIRGQKNIELGKSFEYSVKITGQVERRRWNVTGGQLLDEWYKGDNYYARVRWDTMNADNPSHIEALGEDDCKMRRSETLYVTRTGGSGTPPQQNGGNQCGALGKIQGPETVVFGQMYTYSSVVTGTFDRGGWSVTGGNLLKEWWQDNSYYAQITWRENNPKNPSHLKIWGDDACGKKDVNQKLYITTSRGGSNNTGGGFGPPQTQKGGVTLYSGENYQGFSETYTRDVVNFEDTKMGHDRALSIQVSPGCEAILYRKSKYLGDRDIFTQNAPNLNHTKVGKFTSSLKVSCN